MHMTFAEYSERAKMTSMYPPVGTGDLARIIYPAIKLSGEVGEFMEKIGKLIRDEHGIISTDAQRRLALELGDILWYWMALVRELDLDPSIVAEMNLVKLDIRMQQDKIHGEGDDR